MKHADSPVYVRARARGGILRVSVWDDHPEPPEPLVLTITDPFGRGLYLVQHPSRSWGRYPLLPSERADAAASGKVAWFELATQGGQLWGVSVPLGTPWVRVRADQGRVGLAGG